MGFRKAGERLLAVVASNKTEALCLKFARRFADTNGAEIYVIKPKGSDPGSEVRRAIVALDIDWLCMVAHGGPGLMTLFLKSEDEAILRAAPCPVVCIPEAPRGDNQAGSRPAGATPWPIRRILVPLSSALASERAISSAAALAKWFGARIDLLGVEEIVQKTPTPPNYRFHAVRPARAVVGRSDLIALAKAAVPRRFRGRAAVRRGLPLFYATIQAQREFRSDLVVLAEPVGSWSARGRIDSRTERILRSATCPVVCIPEPGCGLH